MPDRLVYRLLRPLLFRLDPEFTHHLSLSGFKWAHRLGLTCFLGKPEPDPVTCMGLTFPNPVGLAAGLDKDGDCIDAFAALGFGFIEIGTVTPRPQPGNPQPRLSRLPEHRAIINHMGFNNQGVDALVDKVRASKLFRTRTAILGINIGKNADTPIERALDDYRIGLAKVYPVADYVAINISSPNTKNLRQLQGGSELDALLGTLRADQARLVDMHKRYVPLALKIAPDLNDEQIAAIAAALIRHKIDGVIATNTTLSREAIAGHRLADEAGGLSGAPVRAAAEYVAKMLHAELKGALPIIGAGGILSGEDARARRAAGATLIQLYSGLIFKGPALIREVAKALRR